MKTPTGLPPRHRALLVTLSAAALLITSAGPSMAATAGIRAVAPAAAVYLAPPAGLKVVAITQSAMNLIWKPVRGAVEYRLAYSTRADMGGTEWRDTNTTSRTIYLKPGTRYFIKVRALDKAGQGIGNYSAAVQATTKPAPAAPAALKATRTTPTTMGLSWGKVAGAARYRVELTRPGVKLPAAYTVVDGTSADLRALTPAAGYSARVQALTVAGDALTSYGPVVTVKTPAIPVLAPVTNPLKVASYNIHCANCMDDKPGERTWVDRRAGVIADVVARMPDIIGFQEASQGWLDNEPRRGGLSQFEDLKERLAAAGGRYEVTDADRNNCVDSTRPSNCVYKDQGASKSTRIFYNPDKITVLRTGSRILPLSEATKDSRLVAWAEVVQKSSGKKFFFADSHLSAGTGDEYTEKRRQEALLVTATIARENTGKLPVILVGDMNTSKWKTPSNAAYDVFVRSGLIDPLGNTYGSWYASGDAPAEKVINRSANSYNGYATQNVAGKPGTSGSYLDYIFTSPKTRVQLYENVANFDKNGNRVGPIPSDHNMQFAIVGLP